MWAILYILGEVSAGESLEGKRFTVEARVEYASGAGTHVEAQLVPADFTVPEGYYAAELKYSYGDAKSDRQSTSLGPKSIYSYAEKRYLSEASSSADFYLKPGKYRFSVGGRPGAVGVLSYTLRRGRPPIDEKLAAAADRIIQVLWWSKDAPNRKNPETYYIVGTKVTGTIDHTFQDFDPQQGFQAEPQTIKGDFAGTIEGNVIRGVWKIQILPYRVTQANPQGGVTGSTHSYQSSCEIQLTLLSDGRISQSFIDGLGESVVEYDASVNVNPKRIVHRHKIPPEGVDLKIEGTWKELRPSKKP